MNTPANPNLNVQDDLVITLDYILTVDGEIYDRSEEGEPIDILQGHRQIIPGLEQALYGLQVDDSLEVDIEPDDGYGEEDEQAYAAIPRHEFPEEIPLEIGVELQLRDKDGDELEAFIEAIDDEIVRLNFNHPLAGKRLHFWVKILGIRPATDEELEHGHAHAAGGHHD